MYLYTIEHFNLNFNMHVIFTPNFLVVSQDDTQYTCACTLFTRILNTYNLQSHTYIYTQYTHRVDM